MDTAEAARRFVRVWQRAWAAHDVDAILELYARDCEHRSTPFREPHRGHEQLAGYLRWSFTDERVNEVRFSEPMIGQDGLAVAEFRVMSESNGDAQTLAGCVFVRFDADGLAVATRDYWHLVPVHTHPARPMFLLGDPRGPER